MSETLVSNVSVDSLNGTRGNNSNGFVKKERNYSNGGGKFKREGGGEPRPITGPLAKAITNKHAEISAVTAQINSIDAELVSSICK